jgi:hypothetical protein
MDPDPLFIGTYPGIRNRTRMSRNPNTASTTVSVPTSKSGPFHPLFRKRVSPLGTHPPTGEGVPIRTTGEKALHCVYSVCGAFKRKQGILSTMLENAFRIRTRLNNFIGTCCGCGSGNRCFSTRIPNQCF